VTALTLSVPANFVRLEREKHETHFLPNKGGRIHTLKNTALPENPNLRPSRMAVYTKQKHFLQHKRTYTVE